MEEARQHSAVTEKPNITIHIPEDVTRDMAGFFQRLLGPVAEAADFLSERIRFYRWQSAMRVLKRAEEIAQDEGIEPKQVPLKFLIPFMEKASLEDESSELTEEWARLLLAGSNEQDAQHILFIDILSKLTSFEVRYLKQLWEKADPNFFNGPGSYYHSYGFDYVIESKIKSGNLIGQASFSFLDQDAAKFGRNLIRMEGNLDISDKLFLDIELAKKVWAKGFDASSGHHRIVRSVVTLQHEGLIQIKSFRGKRKQAEYFVIWSELTPLGFDFVSACEGPRK
ncbi:Abi-alpha family protein [Ferrovibrio xuzhouensis]|uniref:DUF4393 domain-containing protein n=1 Tax=Ferrovibrio xuzhouensis TaxID=1576914 RepID=A0ABV7VJ48_9PROT